MCVPGHVVEVKLLWTVVHENVKVYMNQYVNFFFEISLNIFKNCSQLLNCANFSKFVKFVKIVFDAYLNFIKLSNISKIVWQASSKF